MECTAISAPGENCKHKNTVILCHNVTVSHLYGSASRQMLVIVHTLAHSRTENMVSQNARSATFKLASEASAVFTSTKYQIQEALKERLYKHTFQEKQLS